MLLGCGWDYQKVNQLIMCLNIVQCALYVDIAELWNSESYHLTNIYLCLLAHYSLSHSYWLVVWKSVKMKTH